MTGRRERARLLNSGPVEGLTEVVEFRGCARLAQVRSASSTCAQEQDKWDPVSDKTGTGRFAELPNHIRAKVSLKLLDKPS